MRIWLSRKVKEASNSLAFHLLMEDSHDSSCFLSLQGLHRRLAVAVEDLQGKTQRGSISV
jgi:hypothetical protein